MDRFKNLLEKAWLGIRKARARLLAKMYARCRETHDHTAGNNRCLCEDYCDSIEKTCREVDVAIPGPSHNGNAPALLKRYLWLRYSWAVRCTFYKGKLAEKQLLVFNAKGFAEALEAWEKLNGPRQTVTERLQRTETAKSTRIVISPQAPKSSPSEPVRKTTPPIPTSKPREASLTTVAGAIIDNSF